MGPEVVVMRASDLDPVATELWKGLHLLEDRVEYIEKVFDRLHQLLDESEFNQWKYKREAPSCEQD